MDAAKIIATVLTGLIAIIALCWFAIVADSRPGERNGSDAPQAVRCYSGGVLIYDGRSTSTVWVHNSGNITFRASDTHKITEVSGNCVMTDAE